ncbi:hypothetical protein OIU76_007085 [Salix suchowensis]|nr:hypothetical protein OIU76_007085 [Salix suchowensis]
MWNDYSVKWYSVDSVNIAGGILVMWNEGNFEVEIVILQAEQWRISECAEAIWMEKSRQNGWCKLGDKNTQFFHLTCSTKQNGRVRARMGPEGLKTLSSLQIRELQQDITMDEVRQAVRDCDGSKAPSPDGFTFTFYKKALLLTGMYKGPSIQIIIRKTTKDQL